MSSFNNRLCYWVGALSIKKSNNQNYYLGRIEAELEGIGVKSVVLLDKLVYAVTGEGRFYSRLG